METRSGDIRKELQSRISEIQKKMGELQTERANIDEKLKSYEEKITALRTVYSIEAEKYGEPKVPLFVGEGVSYRFAGMRLIDALRLIKKEKPKIDKHDAHKLLLKEGFDFKGKRSLSAVHFAWIALENSERKNK